MTHARSDRENPDLHRMGACVRLGIAGVRHELPEGVRKDRILALLEEAETLINTWKPCHG